MFFSSTILFLSQVDGICDSVFFKIKDDKKKLKEFLNKNVRNNEPDYIVSTILEKNAIDDSTSNRNKYPSKLNRHSVMHGIDYQFGTEINSLKSISLLNYLIDFVLNKN